MSIVLLSLKQSTELKKIHKKKQQEIEHQKKKIIPAGYKKRGSETVYGGPNGQLCSILNCIHDLKVLFQKNVTLDYNMHKTILCFL